MMALYSDCLLGKGLINFGRAGWFLRSQIYDGVFGIQPVT